MAIKRYDLEHYQSGSQMEEHPDGDWVRYEDVAELVEALRLMCDLFEPRGEPGPGLHAQTEARRKAYDLLVRLGELQPAGGKGE